MLRQTVQSILEVSTSAVPAVRWLLCLLSCEVCGDGEDRREGTERGFGQMGCWLCGTLANSVLRRL